MAITGIRIIQDNKIDSCDLLSIHNLLAFIVEVDYTSSAPDELYVDIVGESLTFSCILFADPQAGKRQFVFFADEIIRGLMFDFDDTVQPDSSFETVPYLTKGVTLLFRDPLVVIASLVTDVNKVEIPFIASIASRQIGESPSLNTIFENDDESYNGIVGFPCYVYFYNDKASNVITLSES